jgi:hypothetical protein
MDSSGLLKHLVTSGGGGGGVGGKLQQVSDEAMEVLKKKIGVLKHESAESAQKMAAAEKASIVFHFILVLQVIKNKFNFFVLKEKWVYH